MYIPYKSDMNWIPNFNNTCAMIDRNRFESHGLHARVSRSMDYLCLSTSAIVGLSF